MTNIRIEINKNATQLPSGYSLYQCGDDFQALGGARECASGGCPAVVPLPTKLTAGPDTIFDQQWQYYVYAINKGMDISAIIALMGDRKALFNNTGIGYAAYRRNYLTFGVVDTTAQLPRLDKLRTFCLNTHAMKEEGDLLRLLTLDGNNPPPLKPGRTYPVRLEDVNPDDYLYLPETHRWLFLDCSNVRWKRLESGGNYLSYGPFDNGLVRPWLDNRPHSFFPLVSRVINLCPKANWNKVNTFPSPFR